ncbi:hypothetical protein JD969_17960 [Planctomycetota bacterium]|nr:hypothetical protein JD969_17960 [Planctomycetota bacterium]
MDIQKLKDNPAEYQKFRSDLHAAQNKSQLLLLLTGFCINEQAIRSLHKNNDTIMLTTATTTATTTTPWISVVTCFDPS